MQSATMMSKIKRFYNESNALQKVAVGYAIVVLLMLLFPPFVMHYPGGATVGAGYGFILSGSEEDDRATIDAMSLAIQLISVSLIAAALWIAASAKITVFHAEPVSDYERKMNAIDDEFENGNLTFKEWSSQHDAILSQQIKAEISLAMRSR